MHMLADKVFIVAGGGSGIGEATAVRLARHGARVVVGDLRDGPAHEVAARIVGSGGDATAQVFDIVDEASVRALVSRAVDRYGGLDGIHINAADLDAVMHDSDAVDVPLAIYDRTLEVNLRGHLLCTRHAVPALLARGGGAIVYTSSGAAFMGEASRVAYAMAKSGLHALLRHVASRWGKQGIRANAVAPGLVMTDAVRRAMSEEACAQVLAITRSPRLGEPEDIAAAVAFLLSDDASWINGQVLSVDGGVTLR
jgi:NAD(P)-dependent dehydrogenase (short-subunit alcohol dehydrogenase family)